MDIIGTIKKLRIEIFKWIFSFLPIKENKVLLWSDLFKTYSCNPKYLALYLLEFDDKYQIRWVIDRKKDISNQIPQNLKVVQYFSITFLYELATSKIIITNTRIPDFIDFRKRKNQYYIQTWHSSMRLKKIEKDSIKELSETYIDLALKDSKKIDCIISGCKFSSNVFRNSFWYSGRILEVGTPRIDYLLNTDKSLANKVRKHYGLSTDINLALYAPTFRKQDDLSAYNLNIEKISKSLEKRFGGSWKILIRMHPNLADLKIKEENQKNSVDVTSYIDMQELIVASNVLITDYSSCMFDFAYIKKPCFLYVPDYEDYIKNQRQLYFDINELPFSNGKNSVDLGSKIENFNEIEYEKNIEEFLKRTGSYENGNACYEIEKLIHHYCGIEH